MGGTVGIPAATSCCGCVGGGGSAFDEYVRGGGNVIRNRDVECCGRHLVTHIGSIVYMQLSTMCDTAPPFFALLVCLSYTP